MTGRLTVDDLNAATVAIAKIVQSSAYAQEIKDLKSNGVVRASSKIAALNPELDAQGVLRVNGRGQKRVAESTMGRQIILPRNHAVASSCPPFHWPFGARACDSQIAGRLLDPTNPRPSSHSP